MFWIKQCIKMLLQNVLLPPVYRFFSRKPVQEGLVLFADMRHDQAPFSMERMYEAVRKKEADGRCTTELFLVDQGKMSAVQTARYLLRFMRRYAQAEYVFLCDYFLPAAACRKRPETKVVQLWHSCGLMKKIAFDTGEDIPKNYRGSMFDNYTYLTLSAEICVPVHARALRLGTEHIFATGVSRTDFYFDREWNAACRERFFRRYPEAAGRKIAVWAPTFRGNAASPRLEGLEAVRRAAQLLAPEWYLIIRAHPHVDAHGRVSNCDIPTPELFPVADVLITDYSSVLFDWLVYRKPAVLFAPDLAEYEQARGFYLDYRAVPYPIAQTEEELVSAVQGCGDWMQTHRAETECFRKTYIGACDGHATERILKLIGLEDERL